MYLLVIPQTVEDVVEDLSLIEQQILEEKIKTENRLANLRKTALSLRTFIVTFTSNMEALLPNEHALLKTMQQHLKKIQMELFEKMTEAQKDNLYEEALRDPDNVESYEKTKQHNAELSSRTRKSKEKSEGSKRIFRKIAKDTHPDKTKDPWKNELFSMALVAFKEDNYAKLEQLLMCLYKKTTLKALLLEKELLELRNQESIVTQEITLTSQSEEFKLSMDYNSGLPNLAIKSSMYYQQKLSAQIVQLVEEIRKHEPEAYPEVVIAPKVIYTTSLSQFSTTTSSAFWRV